MKVSQYLGTALNGAAWSGIDRGLVAQSMNLLFDPEGFHEIKVCNKLGHWESRFVSSKSRVQALDQIEELSHNSCRIYWSLNPIIPPLGRKNIRNEDVVSYYWLMIDCDRSNAVKIATNARHMMATQEEKAKIQFLVARLVIWLGEQDWPEPIILDSGSGYHVLFRILLGRSKESRDLIKRVLLALSQKFDTADAEIDRETYKSTQGSKLPGTWVRKGPNLPDRPHVQAKLIKVPAERSVVTQEQLEAVAALSVPEKRRRASGGLPDVPARHRTRTAPQERERNYVEAAIERETAAVTSAPDHHNDALNAAAFSLGTLVNYSGYSRSAIERELERAGEQVELSASGIRSAIRSGLDSGEANPRDPLAEHERNGVGRNGRVGLSLPRPTLVRDTEGPPSTGKSGHKYDFRLTVNGSTVTPKKIDWLWQDRIPYGELTLFAGMTSVGKTFVLMDLVARITSGSEIPLSPGEHFEPMDCMILSEASREYILAPRLAEAGADTNLVHYMSWDAMLDFEIWNTDMLDDAYEEANQPGFIIIDPPTNFLGQVDEHRNAEMRRILMRLWFWVQRKHIACVLVTHTKKGFTKGMSALDKIIGSVAWSTCCQCVHLLGHDPEDPSRRLFLSMKTNISPDNKPGLVYTIEPCGELARVQWLERTTITADEAVSGEPRKPRGALAVEWLTERFRENRSWSSNDLKRLAGCAGISKNALWSDEVKTLPIEKKERMDADTGKMVWYWTAREGWPEEEAQV